MKAAFFYLIIYSLFIGMLGGCNKSSRSCNEAVDVRYKQELIKQLSGGEYLRAKQFENFCLVELEEIFEKGIPL